MTDKLYREHDPAHGSSRGNAQSPGRLPATARLAPRPIFRVASGEASGRDGNGVAAHADSAVEAAAGSSGAPLPSGLREQFEGSLGANLGGVRIHTGSESAQAAHAVGARAYTVGSDIHFGAGQYQPSDPFGMHLVAHEVAHTVQQAGGPAHRQHKLEVSTPGDAAEVQADQAADAMVRGESFSGLGPAMLVNRKVHRDISYGSILGAGDAAEKEASNKALIVDHMSISGDLTSVAGMIADINKYQPVVLEAERDDSSLAEKYAPSVTNATTLANLQIFNDKLDVTNLDTAAFSAQYRNSYADYRRLSAEGTAYLSAIGVHADDSIDQLTTGFGAAGKTLKLSEDQAGLDRFRTARRNLNTSATKMDGTLKGFRGAAQLFQGALYGLRQKAAAKEGADAAKSLAELRAEIDEIAKNVGLVVKIAGAVSGFAGGGAVSSTIGDAAAAGESASKMAIAKAVYKDADGLSGDALGKVTVGSMSIGDLASGDPAKIAEGLVKTIGERINKAAIQKLEQKIAIAAATEKAFASAAEASTFDGHQTNLEAKATELSVLVVTYRDAKAEMSAASEALMASLAKGGKKGSDQAKGVLFLTDADRFLAQVRVAITNGENQQKNAGDASKARKELRGTTSSTEAEPNRLTQRYWKATKYKEKGIVWDSDRFQLSSVDVKFSGSGGFGYNDMVQGGNGTVEGTGGVADEVADRLRELKTCEKQVQTLQQKIQGSLGLGGPGLNA